MIPTNTFLIRRIDQEEKAHSFPLEDFEGVTDNEGLMEQQPDNYLITRLEAEDHADLLELLDWWRKKRQEEKTHRTEPLEIRPVFKRKKTIARSVRLDESMVKAAAEKKAKEDRVKTGGTFNGLVELLIWEYLNRPGDFIETE